MYSNCCCSGSFEPEIMKISQSSHKMYSNNMLNLQESTTILNACTKKSGNLLKVQRTWNYITMGKQTINIISRLVNFPASSAGCLLLSVEWMTASLQDSCLYDLESSSALWFFRSLFQALSNCSFCAKYYWYHCHLHVTQIFLLSGKIQTFVYLLLSFINTL